MAIRTRRRNPVLDAYHAAQAAGRRERDEFQAAMEEEAADRHQDYRYVYFIEAVGRDLVKIGSANDPQRRLRGLQTSNPDDLVLRAALRSDDAVGIEHGLHVAFARQRLRGEWFRIDAALRSYIEAIADGPATTIYYGIGKPEREPSLARLEWLPDDTMETFGRRFELVYDALFPPEDAR